MIRRPPRSTLFPLHDALPIWYILGFGIAPLVAAAWRPLDHPSLWRTVLHGHLFVFYSVRSEEHTSELQSRQYLVCRLLLEKKKKKKIQSQLIKYLKISEKRSV